MISWWGILGLYIEWYLDARFSSNYPTHRRLGAHLESAPAPVSGTADLTLNGTAASRSSRASNRYVRLLL